MGNLFFFNMDSKQNYKFDDANGSQQQGPNIDKAKLEKSNLVNRLYDQGFSHWTMPSVNRPNTKNSHMKPLNCK